jgi:hypothetical protein
VRVKPVIALAVVLVLSGCTAAAAPTPPPLPSVTPTAAPDPGDDTVFIITATTAAADGSTVELTMTGHANQPYDDPDRADIAESYLEQCEALGGRTVMDSSGELSEKTLAAYGSSLMVIDTVSTPAATDLAGGIELLLGHPFYTVVASGDGLSNPYANECFGGYQIDSTGSVRSITNYETGSPTPDLAQWRSGRYGFSVAFDSSAVLSDCAVTLTQLALDSDVLDIDGWYSDGGSDLECAVGYRGT